MTTIAEEILIGRLESQERNLRNTEAELDWINKVQPVGEAARLEIVRAVELLRQVTCCLEAARHRTLDL